MSSLRTSVLSAAEKNGSTALGHMSLASWVHLRKGRSWTTTRSDEDMEVFRQGSLCLPVGKKKNALGISTG